MHRGDYMGHFPAYWEMVSWIQIDKQQLIEKENALNVKGTESWYQVNQINVRTECHGLENVLIIVICTGLYSWQKKAHVQHSRVQRALFMLLAPSV